MNYNCPNCGAVIDLELEKCPYCGTYYRIRGFKDIAANTVDQTRKVVSFLMRDGNNFSKQNVNLSRAICFLSLKQYDFALKELNIGILSSIDNAECYFYKAIALTRGKRPFLLDRRYINEIEKNLESATLLKDDPKFYFLYAIIRYDYHERKKFNVVPSYKDYYQKALSLDLSEEDEIEVYNMLGYSFSEIFK